MRLTGARRPTRGARTRRLARLVGAAGTGYLLGTIPSADIVARLATGGRTDLRATGSGNPGAANAMRVIGTKWGLVVMAADIGKGAAASALGRRTAGGCGSHVGGSAAVVGHCFPVWTGFRGGKGVAAGVGQCAVTFPAYFGVDLGVAALCASRPRWRQRAFASTVVASVAWILAAVLWWRKGWPNWWGPAPTAALPLAAATSSAVIIYRFATAQEISVAAGLGGARLELAEVRAPTSQVAEPTGPARKGH
jgi:glycerol-3-phosphate acyltransferase PlsY